MCLFPTIDFQILDFLFFGRQCTQLIVFQHHKFFVLFRQLFRGFEDSFRLFTDIPGKDGIIPNSAEHLGEIIRRQNERHLIQEPAVTIGIIDHLRIVCFHIGQPLLQLADFLLVLLLFILHLNNLGIEVGDDFLTVLNLLSQQRRLLHGCLLVGLRLLQQFLGVGYFVFDFLLVLLELSAALPTLRKSLNRQKQQSQQTQQTDRFLTISGLKFLHI